MKFAQADMKHKTIQDVDGSLEISEYAKFPRGKDFPMDGAMCSVNGLMSFKKNNFCEMFFVLEGALTVTERVAGEESSYTVEQGDMCIMEKGLEHSIQGENTKVFIACSPAYQNVKEPYM